MKLSVKELVLYSILASILLIGQIVINFIPNVEVVTLLIILFGIVYGEKSVYSIFIFVVLEGVIYGVGPWWFGYIIIWPLLLITTMKFRKWLEGQYLRLSIFSGGFGLVFGALFALPYIFIGNFTFALTFWFNGLPFDLIHMVGNYFFMLILGEPIYNLLNKLNSMYFNKRY